MKKQTESTAGGMTNPETMGQPATLMTVAEVSEVLRVSTRTVRRLIKSGALPIVSVGRSIRVRLEDLAALTCPR